MSLQGAEGVGARPERQRSHVRIVSGAPGKRVPGGAGTVASIQRSKGTSLPLLVVRRVSPAPNRSGATVVIYQDVAASLINYLINRRF